MRKIRLLLLENVPIWEQLQVEEALLRADNHNWCIINYRAPPAIVMGISAQTDRVIELDLLKDQPIPLVRRFSGGGTVVIDPHTFFLTFIFSASLLSIAPFPNSIMHWTEDFYRPLFKGEDFALKENDYVLGNRKFGGNAQSIVKERWLHHSSLLWNYSPEMMRYLKIPHKAPKYREQRGHHDFLCSLHHRWATLDEMQDSFVARLRQLFTIEEVSKKIPDGILERDHRKSTCIISNGSIKLNSEA